MTSSGVTFWPMANPMTLTPFGFSRNFCKSFVSSNLALNKQKQERKRESTQNVTSTRDGTRKIQKIHSRCLLRRLQIILIVSVWLPSWPQILSFAGFKLNFNILFHFLWHYFLCIFNRLSCVIIRFVFVFDRKLDSRAWRCLRDSSRLMDWFVSMIGVSWIEYVYQAVGANLEPGRPQLIGFIVSRIQTIQNALEIYNSSFWKMILAIQAACPHEFPWNFDQIQIMQIANYPTPKTKASEKPRSILKCLTSPSNIISHAICHTIVQRMLCINVIPIDFSHCQKNSFVEKSLRTFSIKWFCYSISKQQTAFYKNYVEIDQFYSFCQFDFVHICQLQWTIHIVGTSGIEKYRNIRIG